MTIRVTIEVPADEAYAVSVARESNAGVTSESLGTVQPGDRLTTYFWRENHLVLRETAKSGEVQKASIPKQLLQETPQKAPDDRPAPQAAARATPSIESLEDAVSAVLRNRESFPDYDGNSGKL